MNPLPDSNTDPLQIVELETLIAVARAARDAITERQTLLQERELRHGDGHVREAMLACENEVYVLTRAIAKLWVMLVTQLPKVPPPGFPPGMPLPRKKK